MNDLRDPETFAIIGAAMEVHSVLGHGFLEPVYQDALEVEMKLRNVPFSREVRIPIRYKGTNLAFPYRADFVCFGKVIVELKALDSIGGHEEAQVIHYLKATGFEKALILNFGTARLQTKRMILTSSRPFISGGELES